MSEYYTFNFYLPSESLNLVNRGRQQHLLQIWWYTVFNHSSTTCFLNDWAPVMISTLSYASVIMLSGRAQLCMNHAYIRGLEHISTSYMSSYSDRLGPIAPHCQHRPSAALRTRRTVPSRFQSVQPFSLQSQKILGQTY